MTIRSVLDRVCAVCHFPRAQPPTPTPRTSVATTSPNGTVISLHGDPPLIDANGVVWRISPSGRVTADGVLDPDPLPVRHLAYANGGIWRQTFDLSWAGKVYPKAPWLGTAQSPVPGASAQQTGDIESALAVILAAINATTADVLANTATVAAVAADVAALAAAQLASTSEVMAAITALKADFDAANKQAVSSASQAQSAITAFRADVDSRENALSSLLTSTYNALTAQMLSNQQALTASMSDVLAAVKSITAPSKLAVDFIDATHKPQAIPPHG